MACDDETYINNVPVVTCHCALGATLFGIPANPDSSFTILAGKGDPSSAPSTPSAT